MLQLHLVEPRSGAPLEPRWLLTTVSSCSLYNSCCETMLTFSHPTGPDLASSLAAALAQRKGDMGDSDEEESDDEWD